MESLPLLPSTAKILRAVPENIRLKVQVDPA